MPCCEKRARQLLARRRARVHNLVPFVIRLVDRLASESKFQSLRAKIDPGSKSTGLALVRDIDSVDAATGEVVREGAVLNLFELLHRGRQISEALTARNAMRRRRRGNLRYRAPRFLNRTKPKGWLAPSLQHCVDSTLSWVRRLQRWAPITALSCELVRFDLQAMDNPDISGIEYQQGTLFGYEVREYLLEKWRRRCCYCEVKDVPLNIEHLLARARGGSNRISNLALACVGVVDVLQAWSKPTLVIKCTGRGSYQRTRLTKYGFPRGYLMRTKRVHGFATGDVVRATVPSGKKTGQYQGRVAVRASGSFNIQTHTEVVQGISHRHCSVVQRADGYGYSWIASTQGVAGTGAALRPALSLPNLKDGVSRATG